MSVGEVLKRVVHRLDRAGIPHMIAGSLASTFHGVPRSTQDIDVVIDPTGAALDQFLRSLPTDEFYVDEDTARDALQRRAQFNVIDMQSGWKVDLIIRKHRPFSVSELQRRTNVDLFGTSVFIATVEDAIVSKLEWSKLGDSERQLRDVAGMIAVRGGSLDVAYIERWVGELELTAQWQRVKP